MTFLEKTTFLLQFLLLFSFSIPAVQSISIFKRQSQSGICERQTVQNGDSCSILQVKNNISQLQLQSYNGGQTCGSNFPTAGQVICVSAGTLPPTPAPYPDGSCSIYTVQNGDNCEKIIQNTTFTISAPQLGSFNNASCGPNFPVSGRSICISKGFLPKDSQAGSASSSPLVVPLLICGMLVIVLTGVLCFTGRTEKE